MLQVKRFWSWFISQPLLTRLLLISTGVCVYDNLVIWGPWGGIERWQPQPIFILFTYLAPVSNEMKQAWLSLLPVSESHRAIWFLCLELLYGIFACIPLIYGVMEKSRRLKILAALIFLLYLPLIFVLFLYDTYTGIL